MINDMLETMYEMQFNLQNKLGTINKFKESPAMKQQYINQMILAIQEETIEIMRETAYKNPDFVPFGWKKEQIFNKEKFKEEIVDLFHFFLNLCIVADMNPNELFKKYINKNLKNCKRKNDGY